jgi:serine/threonine-protein kinase
MSATPTLEVGQTLARRYRILRLVGEGGMGSVYEAMQLNLGRRLALKVLHPHIVRVPGVPERFQREAEVLARLRHPGSVEVLDYGVEGEFLFLAMDLLQGETVEERVLREGLLPVPRVMEVGVRVLEVLQAAHALGIVHRDLKPTNLFFEMHDGAERVKVLDFGLAALVGEDAARLTRTGLAVGTPGFMPPEQLRGQQVDGRSDLYALGCVLYELLTGTPPFPTTFSAELTAAHLYQPVRPLRQVRPDRDIPEPLEAVVLKALEKLPSARPPDAASMRRELQALLEAPAQTKRGEGKKSDRRLAPLAVAEPKPVQGALPVGVLAPREGGTEDTLLRALSAGGFQAHAVASDKSLEGLSALLVAATNGSEALARAKALASRPGSPPVLLCGPADDWTLVTGALEAGLFDFVPLPLDPVDLTRKVSRAQKLKR